MEQNKILPLPLTFMDEPDGQSDAIIQYEGCPLISVRGTTGKVEPIAGEGEE